MSPLRNPRCHHRPPTPLCLSPCLSLMEMTRSHAGDCLIRRSPPTCAPIIQLMRSFMWSFGSIPSTQTLSSSWVVPPSGFTASLLYLRSICSSNDGFYETEGGCNRRINHVKSHSCISSVGAAASTFVFRTNVSNACEFLATVKRANLFAGWKPSRPARRGVKETGTRNGPAALNLKINKTTSVCFPGFFKGCQNLRTSNLP